MEQEHTFILGYLAIVNIMAVVLYGWDKLCAVKNKWRVPERTLLFAAIVGGSVGALLAMRIFHHKTLHLKFKYGVPLILALQIMLSVYLHYL